MDKKIWFLLLLAFSLRLAAVHFGLPYLYHADEPIVVNHAMAFGTGDLNPHFFKIPPLVSYLLFICYGFYFLIGKVIGFFPTIDSYQFAFFIKPTVFYLIARLVFGVFLGTWTVFKFWKILQRHFDSKIAMGAAGLLAVCFLHVRDSHYIYADIPLVFVLVIIFGVLWDLIDYPRSLKYHLQAGALIGVATALKYNGVFLIIPYGFSFLLSSPKKFFYFAAGIFLIPVCFFVLNPYSVLDFSFFLKEILKQGSALNVVGWVHHATYSLRGAMGFPALFFSLIGLAFSIKTRDFKIWILAAFHLAYYAVLSLRGQPYDRYVLPLMPSMIFFASYGIYQLSFAAGRKQKVVFGFLLLAVALPSLIRCVLFDRIMLAKDNRTVAKEWVEEHVPSGASVALDWDFYMPRLLFSYDQLQEKREKVKASGAYSKIQDHRLYYLMNDGNDARPRYILHFLSRELANQERFLFAEPLVPYDVAQLRQQGIEYVITGEFGSHLDPLSQLFKEALEREGEKVAVFSPYRKAVVKHPLDSQPLTGGPFLWEDLRQRERNGQPLEIYKLKTG